MKCLIIDHNKGIWSKTWNFLSVPPHIAGPSFPRSVLQGGPRNKIFKTKLAFIVTMLDQNILAHVQAFNRNLLSPKWGITYTLDTPPTQKGIKKTLRVFANLIDVILPKGDRASWRRWEHRNPVRFFLIQPLLDYNLRSLE